MVVSGLAVVWAKENTREVFFDVMERREVYAIIGFRMLVCFFGGWNFIEEDANNRLLADIGYMKGVLMGGDLTNVSSGKASSFLVAVQKDVFGGNLDRIQIIKGWQDKSGNIYETVYDVAWGGDRKPGRDGKLFVVGNTVDVANVIWTNTIGVFELITVWTDFDFDVGQRVFYYVRVLEIFIFRWIVYDAKYFDVKVGDEVDMII